MGLLCRLARFAAWGVLGCCGCVGGPAAAIRPATPTHDSTFGDATSVFDQDRIIYVVDWEGPDIFRLTNALARGVVLAHLDGDKFKLLDCVVNQGDKYELSRNGRVSDDVWIRDKSDFSAHFLGAPASIVANVEHGTQYHFSYTLVGSEDPKTQQVTTDDVGAACPDEKPTHFIRSVSVGTAQQVAFAEAAAGAHGEVVGSGGGVDSSSAQGDKKILGGERCAHADPKDTTNQDCIVVSLTLRPIGSAPSRLDTKGLEPIPPEAPGCNVNRPETWLACQQACSSGKDPASCTAAGVFYDDGLSDLPDLFGSGGVTLDEKRAADLFRQACKQGDLNGCALLGTAYYEGRPSEVRNTEEGERRLQQACDANSSYACTRLGYHALGRSNVAQAWAFFDRACNGSDLGGCAGKARMIEHGWGVQQNPGQARSLYADYCRKGEGFSCSQLAKSGQGAEAAMLARNACKNMKGFYACYQLGRFYDQGNGVERDPTKASSLYRFACNNGGEEEACDALGREAEQRGDGVGARGLYRQACQEGYPIDGVSACLDLARSYARGIGGPASVDEAAALYAKTCRFADEMNLGFDDACAAVGDGRSDAVSAYAAGDSGNPRGPTASSGGTFRVLAWSSLGVAAAGLTVGTIFAIESKSDHDSANAACPGTQCTNATAVSNAHDAVTAGNLATAAFVVGGVALAAGVTLWLTAPSATAPAVGVGPGSIQLRSAW